MTATDTPSREELLALEIGAIIHKHVKTKQDHHFIDQLYVAGIQDAADEIALRLAAKPADDGVREAVSKAYYIQRSYDKNSGAYIVSFGFSDKDNAIALEALSTKALKL